MTPDVKHLTSTNPLDSIRAKCIDCSGDSAHKVSLCELTHCALHDFRFGKNPRRQKRRLTPEQRAAQAANLAKARQARNAG